MKLNHLVLLLPLVVVLITVGFSFYLAYKKQRTRLAREQNSTGPEAAEVGYHIVKDIHSHNSFPKMLDVFHQLDHLLARYKLNIHVDLRGYVCDDECE